MNSEIFLRAAELIAGEHSTSYTCNAICLVLNYAIHEDPPERLWYARNFSPRRRATKNHYQLLNSGDIPEGTYEEKRDFRVLLLLFAAAAAKDLP